MAADSKGSVLRHGFDSTRSLSNWGFLYRCGVYHRSPARCGGGPNLCFHLSMHVPELCWCYHQSSAGIQISRQLSSFYNTDTYNGTNVRLDAGYVTDNNVSSVSNKTAYVVLVFAYDNNHFLCVQPLNDDNLPGALNDNTTSWREGPQTNCNQIGPSVKSPSGRIATRIK